MPCCLHIYAGQMVKRIIYYMRIWIICKVKRSTFNMKDKIMNFPLIRFIINLRIRQLCKLLSCPYLFWSLDFSMYLLGARCCICLRQQQDFCFPVRWLVCACFKKGTDSFYKLPYLFLFCRYCLHGNYSQPSLLEWTGNETVV